MLRDECTVENVSFNVLNFLVLLKLVKVNFAVHCSFLNFYFSIILRIDRLDVLVFVAVYSK